MYRIPALPNIKMSPYADWSQGNSDNLGDMYLF